MLRGLLMLSLFVIMEVALGPEAKADRRVALVIGNSNYIPRGHAEQSTQRRQRRGRTAQAARF